MTVKPIPEDFHSVTPYLVVRDVSALIDFLKQGFGAQELHRLATPDGRVMHAQVRVGDSTIMMGEPAGEFEPMPGSLYLYVEDTDAT